MVRCIKRRFLKHKMIAIFGLLFSCSLIIATNSQKDSGLLVDAPSGIFQGSKLISFMGKDIYSFRGIRYAAAPTGRNRFKQAKPTEGHAGIVDATKEGPSCPQPIIDDRVISEDCLFLNVYTNRLPTISNSTSKDSTNSEEQNRNQKLYQDVIVFLHPGAFTTSSGSTFDFGPQILLDRNIILVTINYRLGALGFLSTGDSRAPGNAGLKDQVLALRWIQRNIRAFGGNLDCVTLMGYGAGSWSVSLHMVSPMSRGLFHRAIAMSTLGTNQQHLPYKQDDLAKRQAEILGCPTDTLDNMFDCLYTKPAEEFGDSLPGFAEFFEDPKLIWSPVVEQAEDDEETFLNDQPFDSIRKNKANFVPLITGVNRDELIGVVIEAEEQAQKGNMLMYEKINRNWDTYLSISLGYDREPGRAARIAGEWWMYYLRNQPLSLGKFQGLAQVYADGLVNFPVHRFQKLMAEYSPELVFNYFYVYPGCKSFSKWSNGTNYGIVHKDELLLLFKVRGFLPPCYQDWKTSERLGMMIEHFARTGDPSYCNVEWEPSTKNAPKYLKIHEELSMERGIVYERRMNDWEDQFPLDPIAI